MSQYFAYIQGVWNRFKVSGRGVKTDYARVNLSVAESGWENRDIFKHMAKCIDSMRQKYPQILKLTT